MRQVKIRYILEESQEASSNKCVAGGGAEGKAEAAGVREAGVHVGVWRRMHGG